MNAKRTTATSSGSWVGAGLALGCLVANLVLGIGSAPAKDCGLKLLGTTELSLADGGPVRVQVTANNRSATMELNTASVVSAIMSSNLERFDLRPHTAFQQFIANDITMTQFVKVSSFALGSLKVAGPLFFVFPDSSPPSATSAPELGWLGMDQLWGSDFELDFANNKLNFYSTKHCSGGGVVYWTANYSAEHLTRTPMGNLIFPVELEGKRLEAVISTASWQTAIRGDALRQVYGFDETPRDMALSASSFAKKNVRVAVITQAPPVSCMLTSHRTGAFFYEGQECRGIEAPLLLGLDVVRHLHLYFATNEQVVYFSDADASK